MPPAPLTIAVVITRRVLTAAAVGDLQTSVALLVSGDQELMCIDNVHTACSSSPPRGVALGSSGVGKSFADGKISRFRFILNEIKIFGRSF